MFMWYEKVRLPVQAQFGNEEKAIVSKWWVEGRAARTQLTTEKPTFERRKQGYPDLDILSSKYIILESQRRISNLTRRKSREVSERNCINYRGWAEMRTLNPVMGGKVPTE